MFVINAVVKVVIIATKVGNVKVLVVKNVLFLDQSKMTQKHPLWLLKNPLGTIFNLLIIYSQWWADIYARNKFLALIIISTEILLITSLPPVLVIFYWNHFGTGNT